LAGEQQIGMLLSNTFLIIFSLLRILLWCSQMSLYVEILDFFWTYCSLLFWSFWGCTFSI
jgi:hypothetical protein